jgi:frataxin-like iron-binding protein CyaY
MLSSKDQEAELVLEEDAKAQLVLNTELANKKLWNGSKRNTMVLFTIDQYLNIISYLS